MRERREKGLFLLVFILSTLAPRPAPFLCNMPRLAGLLCSPLSIHARGGAALRMGAERRAEKARQPGKTARERCGARGKGAKHAARSEMGVREHGEEHTG